MILLMLRKQKKMRVKADYHLVESITLEESRMHVATCRRLANILAMRDLVESISSE